MFFLFYFSFILLSISVCWKEQRKSMVKIRSQCWHQLFTFVSFCEYKK